jgi:SAM-dependent methyltransferase
MRASDRVITPEILDSLDPQDPRAIRSRLDLSLIDKAMGNSRWITRTVARCSHARHGILELGAGSGHLCERLQRTLPQSNVTGLDFIPRPTSLPAGIQWKSGDFFETLPTVHGSVCIGSLVLHHFSANALRELGRRLSRFELLMFAEPLRSRITLAAASLVSPFVGEVTRHDMPASIRAGFLPGELASILHLDSAHWIIRETWTWCGAIRFSASKKNP